jgi:hypothetical protein
VSGLSGIVAARPLAPFKYRFPRRLVQEPENWHQKKASAKALPGGKIIFRYGAAKSIPVFLILLWRKSPQSEASTTP